MADLKDRLIGGFRVLQEIQAGSGSQGQVYKAVCVNAKGSLVEPGSVVALKVMAVQDEDRAQWKKLEKRTRELVRLRHPNVVRYFGCFFESGLFNDVHVIVQEFLEGETLKERLQRSPSGLDVDEALRVADAALAGLSYTSGCGIIHRDIKPGNIFLCADGTVKLIDFEIAKQNGGTTTSAAGNIRGSFDYMAPDFTDADFHGDVLSDVFSMGVVLHEILTGKTPYQRLEGDDKQASFAFLSRWAHALTDGTNPIHVSSRVNRLLAHTEEVMAKSLAPRRQDRYADFDAFRTGLKAVRFRNLRNGDNVYQMLQFVGKGGFGEVFKARLQRTGQLVAVKHLMKAAYAERFYREAKIMQKLHDPCFVQFVDFFVLDVGSGQEAFLVMAFLEGMPGSSLRDAIKKCDETKLPREDVYRAFECYSRGLVVMHAAEIFHRDIKPSNLYYPRDNPGAAAIMDLGIARDVNGTATTGQVPGTLDYMPPEVVLTDNRGDGGMDIYALGLCFYEALTGKMAFPRLPTGTVAYAMFFERAKSKIKPVFDDPEVLRDPELVSLLADMTNPELSFRIRDAGELLTRIRELRKRRFPDSFVADDTTLSIEGQAAQSGFEAETVAETVALGGETQGTIATQWGEAKLEALEREQKRVRARQRELQSHAMRPVGAVLVVLIVLLCVGAGGYFAWKTLRNHYAETKPDDKSFPAFSDRPNAEKAKIENARADELKRAQMDPDRHDALSRMDVEFPRMEVGVRCYFRGKEMPGGEVVSLEPGNYRCTYQRGDAYEKQTVEFSVQANVQTVIPEPKTWVHTKEFLAKEKDRAERERVFRETPVDVEIKDFGTDVTLMLNGKDQTAGVIRLKPGTYGFRYSRQDCISQEGELTVSPGAPTRVPMPGKWEKTDAAARREREAKLKIVRDKVVGNCKSLMENEPIETRQDRLSEALKQLTKAIAIDRVLPEADAKALESEIKRRQQWSVGKVENKFNNRAIKVGGCLVEAGKVKLLVFEDGLPDDWSCKVPGYETKELLRDFDGRTIVIGEDDLKAENVQVSLPKIDAGVSCYFEGAPITKPLSLKPGSYSCVYRKVGCEEQVVQFEVPFGKPCMLPAPSEWKAHLVNISMPELSPDVSCLVDGNVVHTPLKLLPGNHVCEFRRIDYMAQEKRFVVSVATPMSLPSVDTWEPTQGLKCLKSAEQYAQQKDWSAAEQALASANVSGEENKGRKATLVELVKKQAGLKRKAEQAIEYYDGEFYGDAVKYYYEAFKLGYSMTDEDVQRLRHAYGVKRKELKGLIEWTKREIKRGRSVDRSVADLEKEDKTLFEWYNAMK